MKIIVTQIFPLLLLMFLVQSCKDDDLPEKIYPFEGEYTDALYISQKQPGNPNSLYDTVDNSLDISRTKVDSLVVDFGGFWFTITEVIDSGDFYDFKISRSVTNDSGAEWILYKGTFTKETKKARFIFHIDRFGTPQENIFQGRWYR